MLAACAPSALGVHQNVAKVSRINTDLKLTLILKYFGAVQQITSNTFCNWIGENAEKKLQYNLVGFFFDFIFFFRM